MTSKQFKQLQTKWYSKLKASGFEDIEIHAKDGIDSANVYLKQWDSHLTLHDPTFFYSRQDYFYKAGHFLTSYAFKTKLEKRVWGLHSEGLSYRKIGQKVRKPKDAVHKIINVLRAVMLDEIIVRPFKAEDKAFIMATWLKGQYYGNVWFSEISKKDYNVQYATFIEQVLARPGTKVNIACLRDDTEVILGYSVLSPATLHWCYVKEPWRGRGIARLLTQTEVITSVTGLTKTGKAIAKKRAWVFNPWAL